MQIIYSVILVHIETTYYFKPPDCHLEIIRNWWPTRYRFFVYLFVPNQLYMFRAMFSPIIGSTWLYLQLLILSTYVAADRCHGRGGTSSINYSTIAAGSSNGLTNTKCCIYSVMLLIMGAGSTWNM